MVLDGSARGELRDAIVTASVQLGTELGEDGLTMRAIAGKLGVSPTALYQHFEGKTAILQEIRTRAMVEMIERITDAFIDGDLHGSLLAGSHGYVRYALANPWLYRVLHHHHDDPFPVITDEQRVLVEAKLDELRERLKGLLRGRPGTQNVEIAVVFAHWWSGLHGLASLLVGRRLYADHPIAAVADIECFTSSYLESLVDGVIRRTGATA